MDKKSKKRIDILRAHLQRLRQQHSGARQQNDDPEELKALTQQIASVEVELQSLTGASSPSTK